MNLVYADELSKRSHVEDCSPRACDTECEIDRFERWLEQPLLVFDVNEDTRLMANVSSLNHDPAAYQRNLEAAGITT